jgi:arabinofuranosyltransferase
MRIAAWGSTRRAALIGAALALLYVSWAYPFIMESSVVAIDGRRYFNLFDDAMISMRYAWNFTHGQGLVWNPGQRVEGYTNLLLTLVMAPFTWLLSKSSAVLAVQIVGLLVVLGCAYVVWKLAGAVAADMEPGPRTLFTGAALLMALSYYPLSFWSLTGMETGILTLLILWSLWAIERPSAGRPHAAVHAIAVMMGLAYLARPDSILFAVPLLTYAILKARDLEQGDGSWKRVALAAACLYLALPVLQEVFRLVYYGAALPNTYYLKLTGMPLADRLKNGVGFIGLYLWTHALLLGMACAAVALKPDRRKAFYLTLVLIPIAYQVWIGGDPVSLWRFMAPVQPIAVILFALGAMEVLRRMAAPLSTRRGGRAFILLSVACVLSMDLIFGPQILLQRDWFPKNFYAPRVNAAIALNRIATREASVGVLAAGVIPYYTGLRATDFLGRTDPYIASLPADLSGAVAWNGMTSVPGHNKYDLTYSIERLQPTYIEAGAWGRQDVSAWVSTRYVQVDYEGVTLLLKRGAPEVDWTMLAP